LYKDYIEEVIPLVIGSLNMDKSVAGTSLKLIQKLLKDSPKAAQSINLPKLIENLGKMVERPNIGMENKNLILACLIDLLASFPEAVQKYSKYVILKTKPLLDDRKRSTRRLAVK
jgi:hypothetical protein